MQLSFSDAPRGKVVLVLRDATGASKKRDTINFDKAAEVRAAAITYEVAEADLLRWFDTFKSGSQSLFDVPDATPASAPAIMLRGREQPESEGQRFNTFQEAMDCVDYAASEPIISWQDRAGLCAVDGDFHGEYKPSKGDIERLIDLVEPKSRWAWRTHGGGLRLVFEAGKKYTAEELCALAMISVRSLASRGTTEFKTLSYHPAYPAKGQPKCDIITRHQTEDSPGLSRALGRKEVSEEEIEEYCITKGFEIGRKYDHEKCPIAPHVSSHNQPVRVLEAGVYCHRCAGLGDCFGSRKPGWVPWGVLLGHWVPSLFRHCVAGFCHFGHARFVVNEHLGLWGKDAECVYRAALKHVHGKDDPRIPHVFTAAPDFARLDQGWANHKGEPYIKELPAKLAVLPASNIFNRATGVVSPCAERIADLQQSHDLTQYGYPPLTPIWGFRVGEGLPYLTKGPLVTPIVIQSPSLQADPRSRPAYVAPKDRGDMTIDEAWATVETAFPGISRPLVKLLIAAKGCAEADISMPPFIFIEGPTGSGKSTHVQIAAAVAGDSCHEVTYSPNDERIREAIQTAKEQGSYVVFNEITKSAIANRKNPREGMDFLLNLTPDSMSHKLYVGAVKLGAIPVCVFTDTSLPSEVKEDAQLARRIVYVRLPGRVDWEKNIKDWLGGSVKRMRTATILSMASACNVILSAVRDEFFNVPQTFREIAEALGFESLENSEAAIEGRETLCKFFIAVQTELMNPNADKTHCYKGCVQVLRHGEDTLTTLWRSLCDGDGDAFFSSRKCSEVTWRALLDLPAGSPITLILKKRPDGRFNVKFDGVSASDLHALGISPAPTQRATVQPATVQPAAVVAAQPPTVVTVDPQPAEPAFDWSVFDRMKIRLPDMASANQN